MSSGPSHPPPRPMNPRGAPAGTAASPPYLFVYGLLQSRFPRNRYARLLARNADLLGAASMPGRLYALKRYPGLRPAQGPDEVIHGELYRLRKAEPLLRQLDAYEGSDYRRVLRWCCCGGRRMRCWVYEYHIGLPEHRRIAAGSWPAVGPVATGKL